MRKHGKHLDFEINLIPCIDLLSVCICFLLLTAVWLHVGSLNVKQAMGGQSQGETPKKPLLWVYMGEGGQLSLKVQQSSLVPSTLANLKLPGLEGHANFPEVNRILAQLKTKDPDLKTALIQPQAQSSYEEIIALMDECKKLGLTDLGIAPL
ncbi:MAG: ExbD/TolR family protein [Pseudobdellovibrionaceae bacterium]